MHHKSNLSPDSKEIVRNRNGESFRGRLRILDRILVALAKSVTILGVTLAIVVLIIWAFTTLIAATGDFLVSMLSVYLLGGLAALVITVIINIGTKIRLPIAAEPKTRARLAYALIGGGAVVLGTAFPILLRRIAGYEGSQIDSEILVTYTLFLSVSLLATGLIISGVHLLRSKPRMQDVMQVSQ